MRGTAILLLWAVVAFCPQARGAEKPYRLWYDAPAPQIPIIPAEDRAIRPVDPAWENWSLPIGNGYAGACVFGRTDMERIQLTDKTLCIRGVWGMATSTAFADLLLDFGHGQVTNYERELDLEQAVARVRYEHDGVQYRREYFMSWPDNVLVVRLTASAPGSLSLLVEPRIPYLTPFGPLPAGAARMTSGYISSPTESRFDGNGRTGEVVAEGDLLTLGGRTEYYGMLYEAQFKVLHRGGRLQAENPSGQGGRIRVERADEVIIIASLGTNYRLQPGMFAAPPARKLEGTPPPHEQIAARVAAAATKGYQTLKDRHIADYRRLYGRVKLDLGGSDPGLPTDRLVAAYRAGERHVWLEELFYNYGRYLLISSSRKGSLPPNLQGVWNQYQIAPWNCNYTHNINIQMNYWGVNVANLTELFEPYAGYNAAYLDYANHLAGDYLRRNALPCDETDPSHNGWTIGTGAGPFEIGAPGGHSGPGTGPLTTIMFWDWYAFTGDNKILKERVFPVLEGMNLFLSRTLKDTLGYLLVSPSASPEQLGKTTRKPIPTLGCAFDQQMVWENHHDLIRAAEILGIETPAVAAARRQIGRLDPVQIGASGQIKEFRDEVHYADLVLEPEHRHISNLAGLYPGTLITSSHPEWLRAARYVLDRRGDGATGWSKAHKMCLWARVKEGGRAHDLLRSLLAGSVFDNLWAKCEATVPGTRDVFNIDANLGAVAGISEMLIQSHEDCIEVLPALPSRWAKGCFRGLKARGGFEVDAVWEGGRVRRIGVLSGTGAICRVKCSGIAGGMLRDDREKQIAFTILADDTIEFRTAPQGRYSIIPAGQ